MKVRVERSIITGAVRAPRSKSHAIRLIFASLLSPVEIIDLPRSDDVDAAIRAVKALGVSVNNNIFGLVGNASIKNENIYLGGSATSLRILIPVIAVIGGKVNIDGDHSLRRRPLNAIVQALSGRGVKISSNRLPATVEGRLDDTWIRIAGWESSQYISGFMIAFCLSGSGKIYIEPPIVSRSYIYLTKEVLMDFGCYSEISGNTIEVERKEKIRFVRAKVEGDYALASFYAASALTTGGRLEILDLPEPKQYIGDHLIVEIYRNMGAESIYVDKTWIVSASSQYRAVDVDIEDIPDLGLSIAPLAAISNGVTRIKGAGRLKIKESDRIASIISVLDSFGVRAWTNNDSEIFIEGRSNNNVKPAEISCMNDHRVAMMATPLALKAGGTIYGAECVNKSNPRFWEDLVSIGGRVRIEE
ncbi:MAG: 3-phosphoshikimate 1-carboxyvinyltransferase [Sulfolobales archaeon]